jgi:predicted HD phosphohydrolase
MTTTQAILDLFAVAGQAAYYDQLVVAALLHDVGHLLSGLPENVARQGIDDTHESAGAAWLAQHFGPAVSAPVRLHVAAKRYLCAVEPAYLGSLSPASQVSLRLQGGPFEAADVQRFESEPHFAAAVALRRWDDAAKIPGLVVPGLESYRNALDNALSSPS